jgi:diguanylate cyclase (GGDEF)-like protein/PAS domain S-box-containing protein
MSRFTITANRWKEELPRALLLGVGYFLAVYLAVRFTRFGGGIALIWMATPLLAVDLRYRPEASWPPRIFACWIASALAVSLYGFGPKAAFPMAFINVTEGLAMAVLMRRFVPVPGHLTSLRELGIIVVISGVIVPGLCAFPAALILHWTVSGDIVENALVWYAAHALGTLTVMPMVKLVVGGHLARRVRTATRRDAAEAGLLIFLLVATTVGVFTQDRFPLLFLPFLPMIITVFRLGRLGAALSMLVLSFTATVCTVAGVGQVAMSDDSAAEKLLFLQFYLVVAALTVLPAATELKRRKLLYFALQESAALQQVITDRSGDIIMTLDDEGVVRFASSSISEIAGYDPATIVGRPLHELVDKEDRQEVLGATQRSISAPDATVMFEFRARRASGELGWFESHARAVTGEAGTVTGTIHMVREVSARKARELDLARAAATDPLTGLANRRALAQAYDKISRPAADAAGGSYIALFDLDHFKLVNDQHGHAAGDEVLKRFALILRSRMRAEDLVARIGGEEFAVLFSGITEREAMDACERVRAQFAARTNRTSDGAEIRTTVSVGLAAVEPERTFTESLEVADQALYQSKNGGRNRLSLSA